MLIYVNDISDASFKYYASGVLCLFFVFSHIVEADQQYMRFKFWKRVNLWISSVSYMWYISNEKKYFFLCFSLNSTFVEQLNKIGIYIMYTPSKNTR